MTLIDQTPEWYCYKPTTEFSKGHIVFYFKDHENWEHIHKTIVSAKNYGQSIVDMGLAKDYHMLSFAGTVHIAPIYSDMSKANTAGFLEFLNKLCLN